MRKIIPVILLITFIFIGIYYVFDKQIQFITFPENNNLENMSFEELKKRTITWNYDDILRNEDDYRGKIIEFDGTVKNEINSYLDRHSAWVKYSCKPHPDIYDCKYFLLNYQGGRILTDDRIIVIGIIESVDNQSLTFGDSTVAPTIKGIKVVCTSC
jgi:hypothetical protein